MKSVWHWLKALLLVALGAGVALGLGQCGKDRFPTQWFPITEPPLRTANSGFSVSFQEGQSGDLKAWGGIVRWTETYAEQYAEQTPEVSTLTGRVKFVASGERGAHREVPLGYEVEILLEPNEDFPCYVIPQFTFVLKDEDGFRIATLEGEPNDDVLVFRGVKTLLRGTTTENVSAADARATKSIDCEILCQLLIPPLR